MHIIILLAIGMLLGFILTCFMDTHRATKSARTELEKADEKVKRAFTRGWDACMSFIENSSPMYMEALKKVEENFYSEKEN